jgi:hypothetical protein
MAKALGRWRTSDPSFPFGARPDAYVPSIVDGMTSARARDAAPLPRPVVRRADQLGEPEAEGELVCRLGQDGRDGSWAGEGPDGEPLVVRTGGDGMLEVRRAPGDDDNAQTGEPRKLGMKDPLAADQRRLAASLAPGCGVDAPDQRAPAALRRWQTLLNSHYRRR